MLAVGQPAPLFEADSTMGRIRLQDWIGDHPIVLIFYPKDETPVCTAQLCAVRDNEARYAAFGAKVIGINPGSLQEHEAFSAKHQLGIPIAADTNDAIRQQYGVGKMLGFLWQQRIVYVIGRDGTIRYARKGNRPTDEILAALQP